MTRKPLRVIFFLLYPGNLYLRKRLAMSFPLAVTGFGAVFENNQSVVLSLKINPSLYFCSGNIRSADLNIVAVSHQENFIKSQRIPNFGFQLLDFQFLSGSNFVLLAAGLNNSEHTQLIDIVNEI